MNLFHIKSTLQGIDRMAEFLKENFVSIGWPGIGDLENVGKDEIQKRLAEVYHYQGQELTERLGEVSLFTHTMQDGDYVLISDSESVYLGDGGDYYYVEQSDTGEDGMCHRRGVTWLNSIPRSELNAAVQELLMDSGTISQFKHPFPMAQLNRWVSIPTETASNLKTGNQDKVDHKTIEEALDILRQAMRSDDVERRERAALAILQYAK
ncbi:hypothetical protein [Cohnella silvisoli]|uniref:Uncharacterized protein n=1 Tax=Cohnella silvisoli TaxID=2873699 RepID=A0ABV1KNE6_9BACL|nr:hypothetical protein [Cohnella silvisoli]MCD9020321.1 hypothetical protein [Cohnella silvisoli]